MNADTATVLHTQPFRANRVHPPDCIVGRRIRGTSLPWGCVAPKPGLNEHGLKPEPIRRWDGARMNRAFEPGREAVRDPRRPVAVKGAEFAHVAIRPPVTASPAALSRAGPVSRVLRQTGSVSRAESISRAGRFRSIGIAVSNPPWHPSVS